MINWSSGFRDYCLNKLSKTESELWNTVKKKLEFSYELGENLFPKTVVNNIVVTLNGRIMSTEMEEQGSRVKYIYGLSPEDLTASKGNIRLGDNFTKKAFETKYSSNSQKSYAFMLSFIKSIRVDAFSDSIGFQADSNLLSGMLSKYKIPEIEVNSNPILCTLDLVTGDYILANKEPEEYVKCISWRDATQSADKLSYTKTMIEINKIDSVSDSVEYYLKRGGNKHSYRNDFTTFLTLRKGLTDIVPIAVRFPEQEFKTTKSGINLVNNLDNYLFDALCGNEIGNLNLDISGEDKYYADSIKQEFLDRFNVFRESAKSKIFSAPSLSGSYDDIVQVACVTKKDILDLTDIKFNNYSFGVMNFTLSCLLRNNIGELLPYSISRTEDSKFNLYLKGLIKNRGRSFNQL